MSMDFIHLNLIVKMIEVYDEFHLTIEKQL